MLKAINTSSVLYHVTGNQRYADDYAQFMQYLDEKVLDQRINGSWFHQLDCNKNNELLGAPYGLGNPICTTRRRRR
ncbi:MAG: AGE family epimerase/isomerase [Lachnospiraceae bacterium]